MFLFSRVWAYHASSDTLLGGWTPYEVGWEPSEVRCPPLEVFVAGFWTGADMMPGVLDLVTPW